MDIKTADRLVGWDAWFGRVSLIAWVFALGLPLGVNIPEAAEASTAYSYVDDQDTVVLTDNKSTIPERYRSRVKVVEQGENQDEGFAVVGSVGKAMTERVRGAREMKIPVLQLDIPGLSSSQSRVLIMAGIAAVILLVLIKLSRSQAMRFLALWMLIMLGIGAPVLMYISDDGPMGTMKGKAKAIEETQQQRVQQIP